MLEEVFFIKIGKSNSIIKSSKGTIRFNLNDLGSETLKNGMIADFKSFESQLKLQLEKIGFKNFFKKKVGVLALPPNASDVEKRAFFDSLEFIGFRETYLINEHFALVNKLRHHLKFENKIFGVLDVSDCKVDYSIVGGVNVTKSNSFNLSKVRFDQYLKIPDIKELVVQLIDFDVRDFFSSYITMKKFHLVLTGKNLEKLSIEEKVVRELPLENTVIRVEDYEDLIIKGLELVWDEMERI